MQPLFVSWDARRGFLKLILLSAALLCARWQKISTSSFGAHYATKMRTFLDTPTDIFRYNRERYASILVELHPWELHTSRSTLINARKTLLFRRCRCYFVNNFQRFDRLIVFRIDRIVLSYFVEKLMYKYLRLDRNRNVRRSFTRPNGSRLTTPSRF